MIAGNNNLDRMRLIPKPVDLFLYISRCAFTREITGVDEDVTRWYGDDSIVGIGDANDFDGLFVTRWPEWMSTEKEYEIVELDGEVGQGGANEVVEKSEGLPLSLTAEAQPVEDTHDGLAYPYPIEAGKTLARLPEM